MTFGNKKSTNTNNMWRSKWNLKWVIMIFLKLLLFKNLKKDSSKQNIFPSFLFDIAWGEAKREINCFYFCASYWLLTVVSLLMKNWTSICELHFMFFTVGQLGGSEVTFCNFLIGILLMKWRLSWLIRKPSKKKKFKLPFFFFFDDLP